MFEAVIKNVFVSLLFFFLLVKGFFNSIPRHLFLIVFSNVIQLVIHIETIVSQQQLKLGYHTLTQSLNRSHTDSLIRSLIHTLTHSFTPANTHTLTHSNKHTFNSHTLAHTLTQFYSKYSKSLSVCSKSHSICSKPSRIFTQNH